MNEKLAFDILKVVYRLSGSLAGVKLAKMAIQAISPEELTLVEKLAVGIGGGLAGGIVAAKFSEEAEKQVDQAHEIFVKVESVLNHQLA